MTPYPIVSWMRSDGIRTGAHEVLTAATGARRTRCGSRLGTPWQRDFCEGVGEATCRRCLRLRAKALGRKWDNRARPELTAEEVSAAVRQFQRAGGVIRRLPAQQNPAAGPWPVTLGRWA